jgi:hypothetical protein
VTTELLAVLAAFYAAAAALPPAEIDDDPGEPDVGIELRMAAERRLRVAAGRAVLLLRESRAAGRAPF